MKKPYALVCMLGTVLMPLAPEAGTPVYKCSKNGSVTYQNDPCPTDEPRKLPTVEQLNAERQKKLRETSSRVPSSPATAPKAQLSSSPGANPRSQPPSEKERLNTSAAPVVSAPASYKCDGRIHCSQMTSCLESKYFLINCPGVKMDGDRDGIPCEEQWCK